LVVVVGVSAEKPVNGYVRFQVITEGSMKMADSLLEYCAVFS
jgi:hypothetical protein